MIQYAKASSRFRYGPVVLPLGLLLGWSGIAAFEWISPVILPTPWSVVMAVPRMVSEDGLLMSSCATVARVAAALTVATVFGVVAGLYFGYKQSVYSIVEAPLHALRSIPATALFPLFLIVIGVGEFSIVALAAYPSLLVVLVNSVTGASLANESRVQQARSFGLGPLRLITDVLFYEALPNIIDGIRTSVSYALVLVIAVEMFIGVTEYGLGRQIYEYQSTYRIPETYAAIIVTGLVGIALNGVISILERRVLAWLPHQRNNKKGEMTA